mgnify:CR=1 FL=1
MSERLSFSSKREVADWLRDLADRTHSMHAEGVLHEAADLVMRSGDLRVFDSPETADPGGERW